jgi:tRNA(fMet)-specific endonuclease VapC
MLDTNALSAFIDGEPAVGARLSAAAHVAIPVIVLGEFRYGISGSRHRRRYEQWLERHLPAFEILGVTEPTTLEYARVRMVLKRLGRPIPANDAWIAALALQHRLPVFSRDEHFDAVPGVRRETW